MKIACQSCQAKYTIADEKVVGKIVKIRCKKCSATIVINGNDGGAAAGSAGGGPEVSETWTVNVADGDQRTMSSVEVVEAYQAGAVNDDTFCWSDGMPDWLPIREITALYAQCSAIALADVAPASQVGGGGYGLASQEGSNGHSTTGAHAAGGGAVAVARRMGGRGSGADLFSGAAQAGGEDDVMTSAPVGMPQLHATDDEAKLTGQRNENSVLFSLNALTGGSGPAKAAMPATSEASGLLDIRQLGAAIATKPEKKASSRVDDIMNLGGGGAFTAALAAPPVLAPAPPVEAIELGETGEAPARKGKGVLLAVLGGGGVLVAAAAVVMFAMKPKPTADVETPPTTPTTAGVSPTVPTATATTTSESASATAAPVANAPTNTGTTAAAPDKTTADHAPDHKDKAKTGAVAAAGGAQAANATAAKPPPEEPKDTAPKPPPPAAAVPLIGDQPFNMGEAKAKLGTVASSLGSCKKPDGPTGSGKVVVTFAPGGGVQSAVVAPPFGGTPTGSCVAGRFQSVRVPPFTGSPFSVTKSFVLN